MQISIKVPGSCGELFQGIYDNQPILITCPINIFSKVIVSDEFTGIYGLKTKSQIMLKQVLNFIGIKDFPFGIKLESDLPIGKGMASSSADLAAVAKAVSTAFDYELTAEEICKLAAKIEPTDATFAEGIVISNPVTGEILQRVNPLPNYNIAIFDFGGVVNTLELNRRSNLMISNLPQTITSELMIRSAIANQDILFKPHIEEIIDFALSNGAFSVNVAHSGTVIGIFFDDLFNVQSLSEYFNHIKLMTIAQLIDGGFY